MQLGVQAMCNKNNVPVSSKVVQCKTFSMKVMHAKSQIYHSVLCSKGHCNSGGNIVKIYTMASFERGIVSNRNIFKFEMS